MKKRVWILVAMIWICGVVYVPADDTDILGLPSVQVAPNVLIIFDTSGSMAIEDVPADPFRREVDYGQGEGYESEAIYRWQSDRHTGRWIKLVDFSALDPTCRNTGVREELAVNGQAWSRINPDSPHDCGEQYNELDLRLGNYLNYEHRGPRSAMRSRLDAAKEVVKQIIDDHPGIRFGLMHFNDGRLHETNDTEGARLSDHGDINARPTAEQLKSDIDAFRAETYTPLAEALAEAGLYYAGQTSWFHNVTYASPIDIECRPNFIILMTDGESTRDQDPRLHGNGVYINNGTIGDYDGDGNDATLYPQGGSDFVDDVAAFLFENDLMPRMGVGDPHYERQYIVTHTIGFKHAHRLLRETALNGGGRYFTAGTASGLARAFHRILVDVENAGNVFTSPLVPASRANGVYAGNYLYMAMFEPDVRTGQWRGNLKKYHLDPYGRLLDRNSRPATDSNGFFLNSAHSYWSDGVDGTRVDSGGVGALLAQNSSRRLYTYLPGASRNLTDDGNAFSIANKDNISLAALGVINDEERQAIINDIHGMGKTWRMGDVLHSEPVVVRYDTNGDNQMDEDDDAVVFVGTNGGVMHAFSDSSGQEQWGFIPPHHLGRLHRLSDNVPVHDYFIDGPPVVFDHDVNANMKKTLVFGDRRGGSTYTVLDITAFEQPLWKYSVGEDFLGEDVELLGQSWGRPQLATIATGSTESAQVMLLPGGYDTNQDAEVPAAEDAKGRAVFSVELESGRLAPFHFYNDGDGSDMTHCIVDVVGIDPDGDGITNSIYAPDLNGNVFGFTDEEANGSWRKLKLFSASSGGMHRKIFYSPDVVRITGDPDPGDDIPERKTGEMVYFGTGDRAHPTETNIINRFYAIKNFWWDDSDFNTMTDDIGVGGDGDLHDATLNLIVQGTAEERSSAEAEIDRRMGWFLELASEGEKVVSSPVVYNRTVYFTTFTPQATSSDPENVCRREGDGSGVARLYGVDYKDGRAVHDHWSDVVEYDPETGDEISSGGKADRFVEIGRSIPSAPMIAIRNGVAMLYVGVAGKLVAISPQRAPEMNTYYWREIKP